jgi:hypothetical protein
MRKRRRWEEVTEDDPGASLLNLFDVWIAFAVALLLSMAAYYNRPLAAQQADQTAAAQLEQLKKQGVKMDKFRPTDEKLSGSGERLGTAYRLANGEVVYVPEGKQ